MVFVSILFGFVYLGGMLLFHSRSLRRRMGEYGTSFQELLDDVRYQLARQLLESRGLNYGQIADMLGYSDVRSFSRAFKRWSGLTPSDWQSLP